jgi:hypothetical protein
MFYLWLMWRFGAEEIPLNRPLRKGEMIAWAFAHKSILQTAGKNPLFAKGAWGDFSRYSPSLFDFSKLCVMKSVSLAGNGLASSKEILRFAQNDRASVRMTGFMFQ